MKTIELLTTNKDEARPFASIGIAEKYAKKIGGGLDFTIETSGMITPSFMFNGTPHFFKKSVK